MFSLWSLISEARDYDYERKQREAQEEKQKREEEMQRLNTMEERFYDPTMWE